MGPEPQKNEIPTCGCGKVLDADEIKYFGGSCNECEMEFSAEMQEECSLSKEQEEINMIDVNDPVIEKAMELAQALSIHCKEHNLPGDFVINGVAYDADSIYRTAHEKGYLEGKAYENGRIAELLGVVAI